VYVATWGDLVKIGTSLDPHRRMRDLAGGSSPQPPGVRPDGSPVLLGYVLGDQGAEGLIHAALAEHRVASEWYRRAPAVEAVVERILSPVFWNRTGPVPPRVPVAAPGPADF